MSGNSFASDGQEPLPGLARAGFAHSGISWSCNTNMETNEWTSHAAAFGSAITPYRARKLVKFIAFRIDEMPPLPEAACASI